MSEEIINLLSLRKPLPKVEFPNGTRHQLYEVDANTERLRREVTADPGNEEKVRAVLRALIPSADDTDWESLTVEDVGNIYSAALRKQVDVMALVESRRKNDDGGRASDPPPAPVTKKPRTPRSSRTTTSRTAARGSGDSTAPATTR